jgi:dCMP deaminase
MLIIGITGTLGAGKGTVADYLVKKRKFLHFSVREFLIKEIKKRKLTVNRDSMVLVANDLRKKYGGNYIVESLYKEAERKEKNSVIESIRSPLEAEFLKNKDNFYLFAVDAKPRLRYERNIKRGSETDHQTYKEFVTDEKREMTSKDPARQNLKKCMEMSDFTFENNGDIKELNNKIEEVIKNIKDRNKESEKYQRPSWDDYFMEVMDAIAKRATCDRGRAGTVIVKDKQILATGYVGSPVGFPHCDEAGHDLRKSFNEDGTISQHCVRTIHSEQNAICQAAKRGISIEGSTVYTRMTPCRTCAMLLINCGVARIYCQRKYHTGTESDKMFKKAGIKIGYKYNELQKYSNQKG